MTNISLNAVKKCYEEFRKYENSSIELQGLKYIITTLYEYMIQYGLININLTDSLISNLLLVFEDELVDSKIDYVNSKIETKSYSLVSGNISLGLVCNIPGHTSLIRNKFSQSFLYLRAGSGIKEHSHTDVIELYNRLYGAMNINGQPYDINICDLNNSHSIDAGCSLSIIESFKISKELLTDENVDNISKVLIQNKR
mgnify:CR=1 FL=1